MIKLATAKPLNPKWIGYEPKNFKFMQVHENEEHQAVSLAKEAKYVL